MENYISLIILVVIAVCTIQVILFFKVWGMTNDIRELRDDYFANNTTVNRTNIKSYLRDNVVLDDKEKVKKALLMEFLNNINARCNAFNSIYLPPTDPIMDTDITPYVNALIMQFAKVGLEVPPAILNMKTYRDYYYMFTDEDFSV